MFESVRTVNVAGLNTACIDRVELVRLIGDYVTNAAHGGAAKIIFSANGHSIAHANLFKEYMDVMNSADLVHADGQSVVVFSRWIDGPNGGIKERTATTDMIHDLPSYYDKPLNHFLLGGARGVAERAREILVREHRNFEVVGCRDGYFSDESAVIEEINNSGCDVLWVGLGKPKEQQFCIRNREKLKVPVVITCGGCFNYVTGEYSRAPQWMQKSGLEWVYRMLKDPKKLAIRYLTTNPVAIFCVIKQVVQDRLVNVEPQGEAK